MPALRVSFQSEGGSNPATGLHDRGPGRRDDIVTYSYTVIVRPEPEGGYTVLVPALPECLTFDETIGGALRMAEEAIGCYLESLIQHGEPVPQEGATVALETENLTEAFVFRVSAAADEAGVPTHA